MYCKNKTIITVILLTVMLFVFCVSCRNTPDVSDKSPEVDSATPNDSSNINTLLVNDDVANTATVNADDEQTDAENSESADTEVIPTLNDIEAFLQSSGVLKGERLQMAAEYVGAVDGFKYADVGAEVYEYNVNSDEYKKLSNGEQIELAGMPGFYVGAVAVNGKFVLIGEPTQDIIDKFNSFER